MDTPQNLDGLDDDTLMVLARNLIELELVFQANELVFIDQRHGVDITQADLAAETGDRLRDYVVKVLDDELGSHVERCRPLIDAVVDAIDRIGRDTAEAVRQATTRQQRCQVIDDISNRLVHLAGRLRSQERLDHAMSPPPRRRRSLARPNPEPRFPRSR